MKRLALFTTAALAVAFPSLATPQSTTPASCYSTLLTAEGQTLSASVQSIDSSTGAVVINGLDSVDPAPFQFAWGDGTPSTSAGFPQTHTYANRGQNYVVTVTATESNGSTQTFSIPVFFVAPIVPPQAFPGISFQIPSAPVTLGSHWPALSPPTSTEVTEFPDSAFPLYSRSAVTSILTAVSAVDYSFANQNSFLLNGQFSIYMLEGLDFGGGQAIWFTTPMSVGYGSGVLGPPIGWSVLLNEIGKDTTLNTPTGLTYGGNTDGNASQIYSETMGAVFSYASGCHLISNPSTYGLEPAVAADIKNDLVNGAANLQQMYKSYVAAGAPFSSWNTVQNPNGGTIATLAWKFIEHAEQQGQGYQRPTQRMMQLLQLFDSSMLASYAPTQNTQTAATFRSTLMVAALSYAFSQDLRAEFEALNFPIDDATFVQLYQAATNGDFSGSFAKGSASSSPSVNATYDLTVVPTGSFSGDVTLSVSNLPAGATGSWSPSLVTGGSGASTLTIMTTASTPPGIYNFTVTGTSGPLVHSTTLTLLVGAVDFTGTVTPTTQTVQAGNSVQYSIGLSAVGTLPFGSPVTLSLSGVPSGMTPGFSTTTVNPDTNGTSVLTLSTSSSTPTGSYTLTLTGTAGGVFHSTTIQLVVTAAGPVTGDFSGSFNHGTASTTVGGQATYALTVTPSGGFTGNVVLSSWNLPQGVSASWSPTLVTGGSGMSTLTVTTSATMAPGSYNFTVSGASGTLTHSTTLTLLVGVVDFTGSIMPTSQTVAAGGSAQYTVTLSTVGTAPFGGNVTLAVSGLPAGVTAGFSSPTINPDANGSSVLTLTTSSTTPSGTYVITLSGTGQGAYHAAAISLTVQ